MQQSGGHKRWCCLFVLVHDFCTNQKMGWVELLHQYICKSGDRKCSSKEGDRASMSTLGLTEGTQCSNLAGINDGALYLFVMGANGT